jgi:hypothetical protein
MIRRKMVSSLHNQLLKTSMAFIEKMQIKPSSLIALFDSSDKYHLTSVEFIKRNKSELITTQVSIIITFAIDDLPSTRELTIKHANLPMDFAEVCLVFLGEIFTGFGGWSMNPFKWVTELSERAVRTKYQ